MTAPANKATRAIIRKNLKADIFFNTIIYSWQVGFFPRFCFIVFSDHDTKITKQSLFEKVKADLFKPAVFNPRCFIVFIVSDLVLPA